MSRLVPITVAVLLLPSLLRLAEAPGQRAARETRPGAAPGTTAAADPAMSLEERVALRQRRLAERDARLAAMTPEQRAALEARRAARVLETPDARRPERGTSGTP